MKKIICYGDSNTFGYNPKDNSRFDENTRWTAVIQKNLGTEYEVINEGVCDRTGFVNNPKGFMYSAQRHFPKMLSKTDNIDILILAIGTNDLQFQYNISIGAVEKGLEQLINIALEKAKNIIIIPPVILSEKVLKGFFSYQFDETGIVKSKKIGRIFRQIANVYNCGYFDINKFTAPSDIDGLHYDENSHKLIAKELFEYIKQNY
jgi:lysophospholipase L1-like esterase